MTYSFAEPGDIERLRLPAEGLGLAVELLNPLNADMSVMRQSIIPGLLRSVAYNQARGVKNIQLYEIGTVFAAAEGRKKAKERKKLAGVLAGSMRDGAWNAPAVPFDFFDAKGVLENLARELALPKVRFRALSADEAPQLQPGRAAETDGQRRGRRLGGGGSSARGRRLRGRAARGGLRAGRGGPRARGPSGPRLRGRAHLPGRHGGSGLRGGPRTCPTRRWSR